MRDKIDYSNLSLKYESMLKEREVLAKETLFSRTEAAKFKLKIESLKNTLRRETRRKEELEKTLTELKNDHEKIVANIDVNMVKISKEQKYLTESAKGIIQSNKRLQTFGLCFHAINERNKAKIKYLQCKLIALSVNKSNQFSNNDKLHPEIENLCYKVHKLH
ncbi:hypothetical protein WH47_01469 [Habropoda laboriosa]|uniref:Uncharacterized protein n=1 Tax=Habropoda laboriosa TaxID=597456 RepID=A0A0L7R0G2_9HYME|nr:hypothetical protein WH47_01469 [Habropoda laboriosa]